MKKKFLAVILAGVLTCMGLVPVCETAADEVSGVAINPANYVDVDVIDLSLHAEETGDFTPVYQFENPFMGKDTSQGVVFEFYVKPTWEVNVLSSIFAINGTGDFDGKLYFTAGSYFGFNSPNYGGFFDANLFNYTIVNDYIKDGAKIRIEVIPTGFSVYANDTLCYDQTILDNPDAGSGDYTSTSDFSQVLTWLAGADTLYFGYGSWWNAAGTNEANADLSEVSFRLMDGTVLMDQLQADKELVESLGGSVEANADTKDGGALELAEVDVEVFDINSVKYDSSSALIPTVIVVAVVAVAAAVVVVIVTKKRTYDDI